MYRQRTSKAAHPDFPILLYGYSVLRTFDETLHRSADNFLRFPDKAICQRHQAPYPMSDANVPVHKAPEVLLFASPTDEGMQHPRLFQKDILSQIPAEYSLSDVADNPVEARQYQTPFPLPYRSDSSVPVVLTLPSEESMESFCPV